VGRFVYGRSYRARPDAVALDPINLPLSPQTYQTARLGGVFGALRGCPDRSAPIGAGRSIGPNISGGKPIVNLKYDNTATVSPREDTRYPRRSGLEHRRLV
jgi:hypothetical protein